MGEFKNFIPGKSKTKVKKRIVYNNAKRLYNRLISIYYDDYNEIADEKKEKMGEKHYPNNLLFKGQRFIEETSKSQPEETTAERVKLRTWKPDDHFDELINIPDMPPLEGDEEEVKEEKQLKILTPNKLLTRPPILLAKIKAGNNLNKLKN